MTKLGNTIDDAAAILRLDVAILHELAAEKLFTPDMEHARYSSNRISSLRTSNAILSRIDSIRKRLKEARKKRELLESERERLSEQLKFHPGFVRLKARCAKLESDEREFFASVGLQQETQS